MNRFRASLLSNAHQFFFEKRARLILELMQPKNGLNILDLGGLYGDLILLLMKNGLLGTYTVADIYTQLPKSEGRLADIRFVHVDENKPLPFGEKEFDLVICNSVIEHVTLPKADCLDSRLPDQEFQRRSYEHQQKFASDICRIAKSYFVQTPHRDFPVDTHLWLPFTNWLPHSDLVRIASITDRFWLKDSFGVDWNLLKPKDMQSFFPDAKIFIERLMGLPKSVVAYRKLVLCQASIDG